MAAAAKEAKASVAKVVGVASYALCDTARVGSTALEMFSERNQAWSRKLLENLRSTPLSGSMNDSRLASNSRGDE